MKDLLQFLKDGAGYYSSTRLFMLLVCIASIVDWMHAVFTVGIWSPEYQTIALIVGTLGLKVAQSKVEG